LISEPVDLKIYPVQIHDVSVCKIPPAVFARAPFLFLDDEGTVEAGESPNQGESPNE
jgi:hypothetical protein